MRDRRGDACIARAHGALHATDPPPALATADRREKPLACRNTVGDMLLRAVWRVADGPGTGPLVMATMLGSAEPIVNVMNQLTSLVQPRTIVSCLPLRHAAWCAPARGASVTSS